MKPIEIGYSVSKTLQIKSYEPINLFASIKAEVSPKEDLEKAYTKLKKIVGNQIKKDIQELQDKKEGVKKKLNPEILTHPNIPRPLHGLAPRTILGQKWWDETRQESYKKYDYCCAACGIHKTQAKERKWLECHENWNINYKTGVCEVKGFTPLCHYCHNFIHSGRLAGLLHKGEISEQKVKDILKHGFEVLAKNNLKAFLGTVDLAEELGVDTMGVKAQEITESNISWGRWRLKLNGKKYKPIHKNEEEWEDFYK